MWKQWPSFMESQDGVFKQNFLLVCGIGIGEYLVLGRVECKAPGALPVDACQLSRSERVLLCVNWDETGGLRPGDAEAWSAAMKTEGLGTGEEERGCL